jgi:tRNA threonylcarbamoyl adenosine modification protein YeaZ
MTMGQDPTTEELVLALHSCTETLGIGLLPLAGPAGSDADARLATFPLGRSLSNALLDCIEEVLPASAWPRLGRIAVATGPGGFTGTRLTVVLARTLAQQLQIPLHGISAFHLIARRLWQQAAAATPGAFWLVREQARHGIVAGLYEADPAAIGGIAERRPPRLYRQREDLPLASAAPHQTATPDLPADVQELLSFARAAAAAGGPAPWQPVLPLYPTSPVGVA